MNYKIGDTIYIAELEGDMREVVIYETKITGLDSEQIRYQNPRDKMPGALSRERFREYYAGTMAGAVAALFGRIESTQEYHRALSAKYEREKWIAYKKYGELANGN